MDVWGLFWPPAAAIEAAIASTKAARGPDGGGISHRLLHALGTCSAREIACVHDARGVDDHAASGLMLALVEQMVRNANHGFQIDRISGQLLDPLDGGNDAPITATVHD